MRGGRKGACGCVGIGDTRAWGFPGGQGGGAYLGGAHMVLPHGECRLRNSQILYQQGLHYTVVR